MQVHHAHRSPEMLVADAEFDPRDRFTETDVVAITYGDLIDSPNTHPLRALSIIFETLFRDVFSTVHILPFFPYSSDRGFSVIDYEQVDPRLGGWKDIERLGDKYRLMFDGVSFSGRARAACSPSTRHCAGRGGSGRRSARTRSTSISAARTCCSACSVCCSTTCDTAPT